MTTHILTQDEIKTQLHYNPETGIFTRLVNKRGCAKIGYIAGSFNKKSKYIEVRVNGKLYVAHRLAWLYMTGSFPKIFIDHINRIRHDNRWINLREADYTQNNQNIPIRVGYRLTASGKYQARVTINSKTLNFGLYETKDEAINAYIKAKRELHEFCTI